MRKMKNGIILLLFLSFASSGSAQELGYEVFGTYNKPILKEKLKDAATISDINPGYPSSWISSYLSVEIMTNMNGEVMKAISLNDTLSNDQKNMLRSADIGTHITVDVKYNPKNAKKDNLDIKNTNL